MYDLFNISGFVDIKRYASCYLSNLTIALFVYSFVFILFILPYVRKYVVSVYCRLHDFGIFFINIVLFRYL